MSLKSEFLSLAFGALLIFVTFGDGHIYWFVGNLDTILGLVMWRPLDVIYPVASVTVFLLYGRVKGNGLKFNKLTTLLFVTFVTTLFLINIDDIALALNFTLEPSKTYWVVIMWVYPFCSSIVFFLFGKKHEMILAQENNGKRLPNADRLTE